LVRKLCDNWRNSAKCSAVKQRNNNNKNLKQTNKINNDKRKLTKQTKKQTKIQLHPLQRKKEKS